MRAPICAILSIASVFLLGCGAHGGLEVDDSLSRSSGDGGAGGTSSTNDVAVGVGPGPSVVASSTGSATGLVDPLCVEGTSPVPPHNPANALCDCQPMKGISVSGQCGTIGLQAPYVPEASLFCEPQEGYATGDECKKAVHIQIRGCYAKGKRPCMELVYQTDIMGNAMHSGHYVDGQGTTWKFVETFFDAPLSVAAPVVGTFSAVVQDPSGNQQKISGAFAVCLTYATLCPV